MQNSGLYAVAAKPSTRGEGAERSEAAEVGRTSPQDLMAEGTRTTLSSTVNTKPQNQTAAHRHCNNPAAAGTVPPHQSPDGDSFPSRGSQTSRQKADLSTKVNKKGAPICFSQQNGCAFFSARFPAFFTPWAFSNKCTSRQAPARRRPECCPGSPESGWTPARPR